MMHSPDPFTDHPDSDDSFEKFVPTPNVNRRRSDAIIVSDEVLAANISKSSMECRIISMKSLNLVFKNIK